MPLSEEQIAELSERLNREVRAVAIAKNEVTSDHQYIHDGLGFDIWHRTLALAAAGVAYLGFQTPESRHIHWRSLNASSTANVAKIRLLEAIAYTGGSQLAPVNKRRVSARSGVRYQTAPTPATIANGVLLGSSAGGNFANQPAGDGLTLESSEDTDAMTVTVYGTKTGALTTVTTETVTLTGTTPVATAELTWETILGIEVSEAATGTITIKEASGGLTVTTIAPAALSKGVVTPTDTDGRCGIPIVYASGATTKQIGIIGTDVNGEAASTVGALAGATKTSLGTIGYEAVSKILLGDAELGVNAGVAAPYRVIAEFTVGSGGNSARSGGSGMSLFDETILKQNTKYLIEISNIGSVTATDVHVNAFWYEETFG